MHYLGFAQCLIRVVIDLLLGNFECTRGSCNTPYTRHHASMFELTILRSSLHRVTNAFDDGRSDSPELLLSAPTLVDRLVHFRLKHNSRYYQITGDVPSNVSNCSCYTVCTSNLSSYRYGRRAGIQSIDSEQQIRLFKADGSVYTAVDVLHRLGCATNRVLKRYIFRQWQCRYRSF